MQLSARWYTSTMRARSLLNANNGGARRAKNQSREIQFGRISTPPTQHGCNKQRHSSGSVRHKLVLYNCWDASRHNVDIAYESGGDDAMAGRQSPVLERRCDVLFPVLSVVVVCVALWIMEMPVCREGARGSEIFKCEEWTDVWYNYLVLTNFAY